MNHRVIRVLVIDDSAYNRRAVSEFFRDVPEITVVGKAADGQEGLQMVMTEHPDVITLDLEMPRLDGFSFLRLLMARQPTPVVIISSHSEKEKVFRALELGALDFVAKPGHRISPDILSIKEEVVRKVLMAGRLKPDSLYRLRSYAPGDPSASGSFPAVDPDQGGGVVALPAKRVVVIAASTGGPTTIARLLMELPASLEAAIAIVQHMPPRFTTTFSERLDRQCAVRVTEVAGADLAKRGNVYICPGDRNLDISAGTLGTMITAVKPKPEDKYVPSADRLFRSAAAALKHDTMAVVLTGMGDDGAEGAMSVASAGGMVLVESTSTAVVEGMPTSVLRAGVPAREASIHEIAERIIAFAGGEES